MLVEYTGVAKRFGELWTALGERYAYAGTDGINAKKNKLTFDGEVFFLSRQPTAGAVVGTQPVGDIKLQLQDDMDWWSRGVPEPQGDPELAMAPATTVPGKELETEEEENA